jgi:DisA checkpoint controller-like protein
MPRKLLVVTRRWRFAFRGNYSSRRVARLVKDLYSAIIKEFNVPVHNLWFVPVGYVAKSGSIIAYYFRTQNNLPQDRFIAPSDLASLAQRQDEVVVFLDDYTGSGNQACQVWNTVVQSMAGLSELRLAYAVLVGYQAGLEKINTSTGFTPIALRVLTEKDLPFGNHSKLFENQEERDRAKAVMKRYGERLYPNHPLGYSESQGLVGFFYSTPNNSLPIFWSSESGWSPLLAHGESYRDPAYLMGPPPGLRRAPPPLSTTKSSLLDIGQLDEYDIDPNLAIRVFSEFRKLATFLVLAPVLKQLQVSSNVFDGVLSLISSLKHLEHEKQAVCSAFSIVPDATPETAIGEKIIAADPGLTLTSQAEMLALANFLDGFEGTVAFRPNGTVVGAFLYKRSGSSRDPFLPAAYHLAGENSAQASSLLFLFRGNGRISVFYKGQRILSHRGAMWHLHTVELETGIRRLSANHRLDVPVLDEVFRLALLLSDLGKGALITVGDHEAVLRMSDPLKATHVKWANMTLGKTRDEALIGLMAQDGATIISGNGQVVQGMTFLRPPAATAAEEEVGKGSKHSTAAKISKLSKSICVAVSVDGRITIYTGGTIAFKMMG